MPSPPSGTRRRENPRGGPSRLGTALVGLVILACYSLLTVASGAVLLALWHLRPSPVAAVIGIAVGTLIAAYLSLRFGTRRVISRLDARELSESRAPGVYELLEELCASMSIDRPRLLVARLDVPNAFALATAGRNTVIIDASLFRLLDAAEFEALLAHELAHLDRHDSLVQTTAISLSQVVVVLLELLLSPVVFFTTGAALGSAWIRGNPRSWPETLPGRLRTRIETATAMIGVAVTLLLRAHARKREFAADERAAEVTGRPLALANALRKLDRASTPVLGSLSSVWTHGEVESEEERRLREYFSTHPPIEDRVKRLRDLADTASTRVPIE